MTLDRFRSLADRLLAPFVRGALVVGVTPDIVSVAALLLAFGAAGAFYLGETWYLVGAVLVFLNGCLDLLDGALARELGTDSRAGDLLDHVLDRYADVAILAGLAAGIEQYALGFAAVTGVLLTSYLGTQIEAVGMDREYGGLVGRADRLALISIVTAIASFDPATPFLTLVGWLLVFLAVVGHLTALQRFFGSWRAL
ncbi:MAG: CDP-alcohol phosphatidyltransferase family protein [Halobacteriales archaeon]